MRASERFKYPRATASLQRSSVSAVGGLAGSIRSALRDYAAPITVGALALVLLGILFTAGWDLLFPPEGDETAKAATAAAALTALASMVGITLRHAHEAAQQRSKQAFTIKMLVRERLDQYVPEYLTPLAAICGDLARTLRSIAEVVASDRPIEDRDAFLAARQLEAFYDICRYTVLLDAVRHRSNALRSSGLVPGIVLSSHEREDQVWKLLPETWGLGIGGSLQAARARHAVIDQDDGWQTFDSFASRVDDQPELGKLSSAVGTRVLEIANDAAVVFLALGNLLDTEIANFYEEWYGEARAAPDEQLDAVRQLPVASRIELGVGYGVTDTDREHYGRGEGA